MTSQRADELTNTLPDTQEALLLETEELLKQLISQVDTFTPLRVLQQTEETVNEVIFESNINGTYYSLVRCRIKSNSQVSLSARELAIARLIAQGFPNKCIGSILQISPWTVSTYLRRIFDKLNVRSRAAMVARLMEESLL